MSLQLAAQHLASKGRGPDTTLVHMAPGEVAGLQALAKAHGGSLTTNPETGLPEAGFLSSILPIIAGAALGPAGLGLSAMQAGLATGALGTLATGSLRKGLMAGLGAYGGAGLMGSVTGTGEAALRAAASSPATGVAGTVAAPVVAPTPVAPAMTSQLAGTAGTNAITGSTPGFSTLGGETMFSQPVQVTPMSQLMQTATPTPASIMSQPGLPEVVDRSSYSLMDKLKAGVGEIGKDSSKLFNKDNLRYGLAALAPLMLQEQKAAGYQGGPNPYQYTFNPGRIANPVRAGGAGEYQYFVPSYTQMADGGTVQSMSDRNQQETLFANGGQRFADGGSADAYSYIYDPITRTYRDISRIQPVNTVTRMPGNYGGENLGGDQPVPGNWGNAFNSQGQPNAVVSALVPIANALNISGQPTGLGMLSIPGAILGNAALAAQQANISNIAESNSNAGATPGGFGSSMGFDTQGFGAYGENVAPGGVEVGGPIGYGDVVGSDIGGIGDAAVGGVDGAGIGGIGDAVGGDGGGGDGGGDGGDGGDGYAQGGISALMPGFARGGYNLGDYSDGGRLLRGPGDGVSDDIPAVIADKRPARLADGEFVVPARIVSELGNGSTDAGARKLYAMMDRIQKARGKTVGKGKVAVNSRAEKLLPA